MATGIYSNGHEILVIGYGSTLRCDDGAGFLLVQQLQEENLAGLHCITTHQLTPEFSAIIAQANEVIFVDTYPCPDAPDIAGNIYREIPADQLMREPHRYIERRVTHGSSPENLIGMTWSLYAARPPACVVAIPGFNFSLGEDVSPVTRNKMAEAREFILRKLMHHA